jgi:hypothetical protein
MYIFFDRFREENLKQQTEIMCRFRDLFRERRMMLWLNYHIKIFAVTPNTQNYLTFTVHKNCDTTIIKARELRREKESKKGQNQKGQRR